MKSKSNNKQVSGILLSVGNSLKETRESKNLSKYQVSKNTGIHATTLENIETGKNSTNENLIAYHLELGLGEIKLK
jgi:transcriptional regulator with XRE-family HTH domain